MNVLYDVSIVIHQPLSQISRKHRELVDHSLNTRTISRRFLRGGTKLTRIQSQRLLLIAYIVVEDWNGVSPDGCGASNGLYRRFSLLPWFDN
ncbi:hypothetical protein TNIN_376251 [Trichonephila inaurata madagascariensis]|uniref:Uncharacterized protein n=1 Tax=Trichonephila inaurata madagascariensis TaxID=2747483 RepID=A0A8X6XSL6_9ARAC|nr:hypothetical protein TNIN_376251 [Trichonephila inaurata madagascariensis]